jgi:hypothetical protein
MRGRLIPVPWVIVVFAEYMVSAGMGKLPQKHLPDLSKNALFALWKTRAKPWISTSFPHHFPTGCG